MKIRIGFVSNSSSSSFTCGVCETTASGWDLCLEDAGMYECLNGHYFCRGHAEKITIEAKRNKAKKDLEWYKKKNKEGKYDEEITKKIEILKKSDEEFEDWFEEEYYRVMDYEYPIELCPLCNFKQIDKDDIISYFFAKHKTTRKELAKEMQEKFKNYDKFKEWLKCNKI